MFLRIEVRQVVLAAAVGALTACLVIPTNILARSAEAKASVAPTTRPVTAKPLSNQVHKGLEWLVKHQQQDGGWSQGENSLNQYRQGEVGDKSNVADTCMATLALLRAGSTPANGPFASNIVAATKWVCGQVENASQDGLFITDIRGTRVQTKLGQYVDTFAAALLLAEVKNKMPDHAGQVRVTRALDKVLAKIQKNQKEDGRWADEHDGWASVLCQSVATKAINVAAQNGAAVDRMVVERAREFASKNQYALSSAPRASGYGGGGGGLGGAAGVELYARAANLEAFQDSANTDAGQKKELATQQQQAQQKAEVAKHQYDAAAAQPSTQPEQLARLKSDVDQAQGQVKDIGTKLASISKNEVALQEARSEVVNRMADKQFVAGFGSNGGEEFLSYMNIGESLALKGGAEFTKWDKGMTENLDRIQNEDGSWSGQHCITGRTFCTAVALMVLTVDRSVPPRDTGF